MRNGNGPVEAYIGIGSNLGDPVQQVRDAISGLDRIPGCRLLRQSSLYRSEAVSDIEQDDFINAVACLQTTLQPLDLLLELDAIEHAFYRDRSVEQRWGPRTLDLDILLYGNHRQRDSHLTIPHPEIGNRLFVLLPLQEVAPSLYIPQMGSLAYLIEHAPALAIQRLD